MQSLNRETWWCQSYTKKLREFAYHASFGKQSIRLEESWKVLKTLNVALGTRV